MRTIHRAAAFLSSAVLAVNSLSALPARQVSADNTYNNIVILGDGISSGYSLKYGESGYYDILADCTDGAVTNYAVAGDTIADLISLLDDTSKLSAIQFGADEYDSAEIKKAVEADCKSKVKSKIKSIEIYIKPEDKTVYYVVNGDFSDKIDL